MDDQDDIIREFLVESHENLDQLDRDLVALEKEPDDRDRLASVFRTFTPSRAPAASFPFPGWKRSPMPARACSAACATAGCS